MLTVLTTVSLSAAAQFSDSVHYYVKYASTGSFNRTEDAKSFLLNNALAFKVSQKRVMLNADASYIYGRQDQSQTNNDVSSSINFNLYGNNRRFYYWGLTSYDKSYSLKINNRFQGGLGVAYDVIRRPTAVVNLSDGILFENADLILKDTIPDKYQTFRNSFRVYYKWTIKSIIVLEGTQYWQQSLATGSDYILKSNNALSIKLRSWLAITAALNYNKVNRTGRENLFMNYGLTVEKYF
ncbi:DUF481 domain-containing protein [uncultured Chitinophaga sp.]|uniref:DUF481 domain-containing protein n=1 Tax=uncultured Chitinophaga sp. TaxID=339340 RepID=UPI0025FE7942|nr:DUF481 domain-containing protein [uncultured Chitinophaga sp.]